MPTCLGTKNALKETIEKDEKLESKPRQLKNISVHIHVSLKNTCEQTSIKAHLIGVASKFGSESFLLELHAVQTGLSLGL